MTTAQSQFPARIHTLFLSAGHDFKGHHGKPRGRHPIYSKNEIECVAGRGVVEDRYFDYSPDFKGQITFFDWAVLRQMQEKYRSVGFTSSSIRRNVIIEGVDLNSLVGCEFEIQGVRFSGSQHCAPCYWMDEAVGSGAEKFMTGRGGLRARILSTGSLRRGKADLILLGKSNLVS